MALPIALEQALQDVLSAYKPTALRDAYEALSEAYRTLRASDFLSLNPDITVAAYVAGRLPATHAVLSDILQRIPDSDSIINMLDLGAGPGTASLAAAHLLQNLQSTTLVEQHPAMGHMAQRLLHTVYPDITADLQAITLQKYADLPKSDLVILSYSYNELSQKDRMTILSRAWAATQKYLLLVDPGTPVGFTALREARTQLIEMGAHMVAPCPHSLTCPIIGEDWCHFTVRIERSKTLRFLKDAALNYEDEKFSYLLLSKSAALPAENRILRHPMKHKGHIKMTLCQGDGTLNNVTVSKKQGNLYKHARKSAWGDEWPPLTS